MKKIGILLGFVLVALLSYFVGERIGENNNFSKASLNVANDMVNKQADGLLSYQHYYEASTDILDDIDMKKISPEKVKNLNAAKQHLDEYHSNVIMQWPEVCDQRDMLSDAIRKFADHHLDAKGDDDIMTFVADCGINPEILGNWVYAY